MSLREILTETQLLGHPPPPSFRQPRVKQARRKLEALFLEAESAIEAEELAEVAERLQAAISQGRENSISSRDWRKSAWCLWMADRPLAGNRKFLAAYLDHIVSSAKRSLIKKLISAYLRDYEETRVNLHLVTQFLKEHVANWDWVWADRHQRFALFDSDGPEKVAKILADNKQPVQDFLDEVGLRGDLAFAGYARQVYKHYLEKLRHSNKEKFEELLPKVLKWSIDGECLRFPGWEVELANALLTPWQDKRPSESVQNEIEDFLLRYFKDPRIPTTPGYKWTAVGEDTKAVILRWLVGAALEQFLQVVDKVAMVQQWRYRKAFWSAYHKAGVIDEAWVAFAWRGAAQAKRSFGTAKGFGKLSGSGVAAEHAVLVMKIGNLTIADWSHNGKCHMWTPSKSGIPKLYRRDYERDDLVHGSYNGGIVHAGAPHGTWQSTVASYIGNQTKIRLKRSAYMPRDTR